ncbi:sugar phosphate isomerase/epimerase family protein [Paludicola sp. MB14-C6]|uniref:sugar phosphate isomerase/epimerase family protein n=1 Tax=Paludihabitans sp. MB14-C6 TaxID=3070656 RepID=UPI0027DC2C3E|nr:sugar phosphate isomerase/epimerase family protein [Paludicola sp. MB14-C6]WMJ22300.1 sugar phosphate isomerase/epimerase family protein [Paludicola sp. MB14-C6]
MKLAFSTLGCPDWSWSEIYATAKDLQFDGIEVRGVANELYVPKAKRFTPEKIDSTIAKLKQGNLAISMLTTGIAVGSDYPNALAEAKEYIDLAQKLSCKYIRIMITSNPYPEDCNMVQAIELYNQMCAYGEDKGVTPLMETNGVLACSDAMNQFMDKIESKNKGVLWDIHHPYRYFNESVYDTYRKLGKAIQYVHVKDSIKPNDNITYRMMGYGDLPIYDAIKLLKENKYDSYISLEWVKRWNPDLEEPGIVFAHFKSYMLFLLGRI